MSNQSQDILARLSLIMTMTKGVPPGPVDSPFTEGPAASRHLNPWVRKESTKLDSLDDVGELLKPGMIVAVDDLDSGYWHLALHPESYQYYGNSCTDPKTGKVHYFQWKVLFLGIMRAVNVFTKITKPIKVYLRLKCGLIILIYINDLMVAALPFEECFFNKFFATDMLAREGWVINVDKGQMPSRSLVYLGFVLRHGKNGVFVT